MLTKIAVCLSALAAFAFATAQQKYAQTTLDIKVGVVLIASDQFSTSGLPANDTPHVWYNFDLNSRVKPAGWNIDNPAHESQVTAAMASRWSVLDSSSSPAGLLTKREASYWEVSLTDVTDNQLAEYDLLLLPAHGFINLNALEREKLRRFMDKGGVLWVDLNDATSLTDGSGNPDLVNNLPLPFKLTTVAPTALEPNFFDPLLSSPNQLSANDLAAMQSSARYGILPITGGTGGDLGAIYPIEQSIPGDSLNIQTLEGDANSSILAAGHVGDGFEVITTRAVATTLNNVAGQANKGFEALPPVFDQTSNAAAKLVVNMVHLAADYAQQGKGSRKANSSSADIGAPLLQEFADTTYSLTPHGNKNYMPPAIFKGLLVVCTNDQIKVYDANPAKDLDGDGNPEEGIPDYSLGKSYNLIWQSETISTGPISAPTCFEVPHPANSSIPKDQICVVDAAGTVWAFDAFPTTNFTAEPHAYQVQPPENSAAAFDESVDGPGPYPPTFHEGLLYIADMQDPGLNAVGRIWLVNPEMGMNLMSQAAGAFAWGTGGTANGVLSDVTGPATVGYVPILDNSGGLDKVLYIPTRPNQNPGPNSSAGITSLWLAAKGERPTAFSEMGGVLHVATRASGQGLNVFVPDPTDTDPIVLALGPKLTIIDDRSGNPLSQADMAALFSGTIANAGAPNFGQLDFNVTGTWQSYYSVRIDYTVDWGSGSSSTTSQILRGQVFLPDDQNKARRILGNIALAPDGTIYVVTSTQQLGDSPEGGTGGSYFAIREEGRGNFRVLTRFDLYDRHTVTLNQATDATVQEILPNGDPVTSFFPFLAGQLKDFTFTSSPVVSNGVVYVVAQANLPPPPLGGSQIPNTILMAFRSDPGVVEINTGDLGTGFEILQEDIMRSSNTAAPEVFTVLQANQYVYEQQPGATNGSIRIDNLSSTTRGAILNCLSTSQPVIIRKPGSPDQLFYPDASASRWSPLLWYTVLSGVGTNAATTAQFGETGPVYVSGNTIYLPTSSVLPNLIAGPPFTFQPQGFLYGISTDIAPNDAYLGTPDSNRPWLRQLYQIQTSATSGFGLTTPITVNPDFRWPQLTGVTDFQDFGIRVLQSTLPNSTIAMGAVGAEGRLFSWSDGGLYGFTRANFVVADEGRLAEFDSVGNPIWSTDNSVTAGQADTNGASNVQPLVSPVRAYAINDEQFVVVDPGANRLAIMDRSGREVRSLESFNVDPAFKPDGYQANESTKFARPHDVVTYTNIVLAANNPFTAAQPSEYWAHFMVADAGNRRIVDLVDRYAYDPLTETIGAPIALGELFWHSPDQVNGHKYSYTSLARLPYLDALNQPVFKLVAGVGDVQPALSAAGAAGVSGSSTTPGVEGGIVVFDGATVTVIDHVQMPSIPANVLYDPATAAFDLPAAPITGALVPLGAVNSVNVKNVDLTGSGTAQPLIMFTDASGAYEINLSGVVDWMLPRAVRVPASGTTPAVNAPVYAAVRRTSSDALTTDNPLDFRPTYAKRLNSGDVLIVNGYEGGKYRTNPGTDPWVEFHGEVIEVDGGVGATSTAYSYNTSVKNLGFNGLSIRFQLPPVTGTRGIVLPVFADRR